MSDFDDNDGKVFDHLVGQAITKVEIGDDGDWLRLTAFGVPYVYMAHEECCSRSWIEHIDGVAELHAGIVSTENVKGENVTEQTRADWCDDDEDPTFDESLIQTYFYRLETTLGRVTIEMRNESNGYYGGELVRCDDPEQSWRRYDWSEVVWREVREDF